MKRILVLSALAACLPILSGCLVNRARSREPVVLYSTNGVPLVGYRETRILTGATGDAKQEVGKIRAGITRAGTMSAGASDVVQTSEMSQTIGALTDFVREMNALKSPIPTTAIPAIPAAVPVVNSITSPVAPTSKP